MRRIPAARCCFGALLLLAIPVCYAADSPALRADLAPPHDPDQADVE